MIIDFHTHNFPDRIAERTISLLESHGTKANTNGTLQGLKDSMKDADIDISVVLPVMTAVKQFETVNKYAAETNGKDGIISFGGIHPECDSPEEKLEYIKSLGLKGVKIHPDYQGSFINDERYIRIIKHCVKTGLFVVTHAGLDPAFPEVVRATPERILDMYDKVYCGKEPERASIILAHLGSLDETDKVMEMIAGKMFYLDTAVMLDRISGDKTVRLIKAHGSDKILFATDSPWAPQKKFVELLKDLPLTDDEKDNILWKNAKNMLNI
ncbi:MAG: metal-dependent hydrolase [Ruminococcaceae bacterium]|nr:metal-dependent hydrolase [Oscillospiraceae bacterium]